MLRSGWPAQNGLHILILFCAFVFFRYGLVGFKRKLVDKEERKDVGRVRGYDPNILHYNYF